MKKTSIILSLLLIFACEDDKDSTGPEVTINSPANNATLGELVTIKVNTTDNSGILKVDFYIDNSKVFSLISSLDNGKLSGEIHNKLNLELSEINFNLFTSCNKNSIFELVSNFLNIS